MRSRLVWHIRVSRNDQWFHQLRRLTPYRATDLYPTLEEALMIGLCFPSCANVTIRFDAAAGVIFDMAFLGYPMNCSQAEPCEI
jgi:hypothetical protein